MGNSYSRLRNAQTYVPGNSSNLIRTSKSKGKTFEDEAKHGKQGTYVEKKQAREKAQEGGSTSKSQPIASNDGKAKGSPKKKKKIKETKENTARQSMTRSVDKQEETLEIKNESESKEETQSSLPSKLTAHKIKRILSRHQQALCEHLQADSILTELLEKEIVSQEEYEHLDRIEKNFGPTRQCRQLLDYLMQKTNSDLLNRFVDVLKKRQKQVYAILEKDLFTVEEFLPDIKRNLEEAYKEQKYHIIEALPGEKVQIDLNEEDCVMPLVFTAQKQKPKPTSKLSSQEQEFMYENLPCRNLEEILNLLLTSKDQEKRNILLTADAGYGKTVSVHQVVLKWMKDQDNCLKKYDAVICIPLRNINPNDKITNILSKQQLSGQTSFGYFDSEGDVLDGCLDNLQEKREENNMLLILDGADEISIEEDSDLYKIITGEMFPGAKVLISSRPNANILQKIPSSWPHYKISITGTSRQGIEMFLRQMMTFESGPSTDEVRELIQKCEENVSFDLLKVPLYLTITAVTFIQYWAEEASFTHFKVPTTSTELFCSFLRILLRIWVMKQTGYAASLKQITFGRNPFHDSNVPKDILQKLYYLAQLSYIALKQKMYDFSESDLDNYLIEMDDVVKSGLFCHSEGKFFYRHKLLHDFVASLYLAHPLCNETIPKLAVKRSFDDVVYAADILLGLKNILLFVFGMSPKLASGILDNIEGGEVVMGRSKNSNMFLYFSDLPVTLYFETGDNEVKQKIVQLLSESRFRASMAIRSHSKCEYNIMRKFFGQLSMKEAATLLYAWYNLSVSEDEGSAWSIGTERKENHDGIRGVVYDKETKTLYIEFLDNLLKLLLKKFTICNVEAVHVSLPCERHEIVMEEIFPNLKRVTITQLSWMFSQLFMSWSTTNTGQLKVSPVMQELKIYCGKSQQFLLEQSNMESLNVMASLFNNLTKSPNQPQWPNLRSLHLIIGTLKPKWSHDIPDYESGECCLEDLCKLFTSLSQLEVLVLSQASLQSLKHASTGNIFTDVKTVKRLFESIQRDLISLSKLYVRNLLNGHTIPIIFHSIRGMPKLSKMGIDAKAVQQGVNHVADGLTTAANISEFNVLGFVNPGSKMESVIKILEKRKKQIQRHQPNRILRINYPAKQAELVSNNMACNELDSFRRFSSWVLD